MRYIILTAILISILSCKKTDSIDVVKYEVILVNATNWHGAFLNENAEVIGVDNKSSGWTYSFANTNKVEIVILQAYPNGTSVDMDCILRIYVNGLIVASTKNSISPQLMYEFP